MCQVRSRKNGQEQKKKSKKKYSGQQQKEIDCDEPHPAPNEKTQGIQWTERPTGALVAVGSLWPPATTIQRSWTGAQEVIIISRSQVCKNPHEH
jgi:hypothetical protein